MRLIRPPEASGQGARHPHHLRLAQRARELARLRVLEREARRRRLSIAARHFRHSARLGRTGGGRLDRRRPPAGAGRGPAACPRRRSRRARDHGVASRAPSWWCRPSPKAARWPSASTSCRAKRFTSRWHACACPGFTRWTARRSAVMAACIAPSAAAAAPKPPCRFSGLRRTVHASRSQSSSRIRHPWL
jgi:hypothetical protein